MDLIKDFFTLAATLWYTKKFPFIVVLFYIFMLIVFGYNDILQDVVLAVAFIVITIFQRISILLPKKHKGKIGILIAISTQDLKQENDIRTKLVNSYKKVISKSQLAAEFEFVVLRQHHINNWIDMSRMKNAEYAKEFLRRTNFNFCLYGDCVEGKSADSENYEIDISTGVLHKPIRKEVSKRLSEEFSTILKHNIIISKSDDLKEFRQSSQNLGISTKYIIGRAAYLSGYINFAKTIFEELDIELKQIKSNIPEINNLKRMVPQRLYEIYLTNSSASYCKYKIEKDINLLDEMNEYLELMVERKPDDYCYNLGKAIYYFLRYRDVKKAQALIKKCNKVKDASWRYSDAFLYAYQGYILSAYRQYNNVFKKSFDPNEVFDIEIFIDDILEKEPENYNLYFALGMINFYKVEDYVLAERDFKKFLDHSHNCPDSVKEVVKDLICKASKYNEVNSAKREAAAAYAG